MTLEADPQRYQALLRAAGFDVAGYRGRYPDLASLSDDVALWHFVHHGKTEGRSPAFVENAGKALESLPATDHERRTLRADIAAAQLAMVDPDARDAGMIADVLRKVDGYAKMLVIGDSHALFLIQAHPMLAAGVAPIAYICSGGSARGLGNPRSRAGYGPGILQLLERIGPQSADTVLMFKFGQVDIEFVYNFRRIDSGLTIFDLADAERYIDETAEAYVDFLRQCRAATDIPMIAMSVFPPALNDTALKQGYVNGHIAYLHSQQEITDLSQAIAAMEMPDIATRTALHRRFNQRLGKLCRQAGIYYLAEFDQMLDENGTIAKAYVAGHDGTDHHLSLHVPETRKRMFAVGKKVLGLLERAQSAA